MANVLNALYTVFTLLQLFFAKFVLADYCEFGLCEVDQYCCGDNKCCKKSTDLWFYWAGALLIVLALAVAAGVRYSKSRHSTYVLLTTQPPEES